MEKPVNYIDLDNGRNKTQIYFNYDNNIINIFWKINWEWPERITWRGYIIFIMAINQSKKTGCSVFKKIIYETLVM